MDKEWWLLAPVVLQSYKVEEDRGDPCTTNQCKTGGKEVVEGRLIERKGSRKS